MVEAYLQLGLQLGDALVLQQDSLGRGYAAAACQAVLQGHFHRPAFCLRACLRKASAARNALRAVGQLLLARLDCAAQSSFTGAWLQLHTTNLCNT